MSFVKIKFYLSLTPANNMASAIKFMDIFLLSSYLQFAVKSFDIQFPAFGKRGEVLTYADAIMTKIMRFFHGFQQIFFVCHRLIAFPSYQTILSA